MKRVFFVAGMAAVTTTALCLFLLNIYVLAVAAVLLLAVLGVLLFARRTAYAKPALFILAVALFCCVRYFLFYNFEVLPVVRQQGQTVQAQMLVTEVEALDAGMHITGKVTQNGENLPVAFKTAFYYTDETLTLTPGDRISVQLTYQPLSDHSRNSAYSNGIYINCRAQDVRLLSHTDTLAARISKLRTWIRERLFAHLPYDEAALMNGLLISDTSYLRPSVYEALRRCGLLHLTAVSGTHLSVFCYSIFRLLQRRFSKSVSAWLTLPSIFFVMAISGFTPSVVRAGFMALLFLVGAGLFKRADALNSLGFALIAMLLLQNPFLLYSMGFVLSFAAMVGMVLVVPFLSARLPVPQCKFRIVNAVTAYIASNLICAVAASLCTAPATIVFFGELSLISPLMNVFCTFPAMLSMMIGAVALFLPFLFYAVRPLLAFILWVTDVCAKLPFASVNAAPPYVLVWVAVTLILVGVLLLLKKLRPALCILLSAVMLGASVLSYRLLDIGVVHIAVANTRDGMAVLAMKDASCMVIGMGGEDARYLWQDYCAARAVKQVPLVLFPSFDAQYCNPQALGDDSYATALIPPGNIAAEKTLAGMEKSVYTLADMEITPFENFRVKVVASGNGYVVQWTAGEITGLICMGVDSVPLQLQRVDYLITDAPPADYYGAKTKVILAADADGAGPVLADLLERGMETYMVDAGETAELLIRDGTTVKLAKF